MSKSQQFPIGNAGTGRVAPPRGNEHGVLLGARQRALRQAQEALRQVGRRREQPRRVAHSALGARGQIRATANDGAGPLFLSTKKKRSNLQTAFGKPT